MTSRLIKHKNNIKKDTFECKSKVWYKIENSLRM